MLRTRGKRWRTSSKPAMPPSPLKVPRGRPPPQLQGAPRQIFALAEAYLDLKAHQNFQQLQSELSDLENKIAASRRFFNNAAAEYNATRESFPAVLFAQAMGFSPQEFFNLDEGERKAVQTPPQVRF